MLRTHKRPHLYTYVLFTVLLVIFANSANSSVCRGYLAKKKYKALIDEKNLAATKIQARYRGHRDRKSLQRKK